MDELNTRYAQELAKAGVFEALDLGGRLKSGERAPQLRNRRHESHEEVQRQRIPQPARGAQMFIAGSLQQRHEREFTVVKYQWLRFAEPEIADFVDADQEDVDVLGRGADHLAHVGFDPADFAPARIKGVNDADRVRHRWQSPAIMRIWLHAYDIFLELHVGDIDRL